MTPPSGGNAYGVSFGQSLQGQAAASYVTGSHNYRVGVQLRRMRQRNDNTLHGDISYVFNGSTPENDRCNPPSSIRSITPAPQVDVVVHPAIPLVASVSGAIAPN